MASTDQQIKNRMQVFKNKGKDQDVRFSFNLFIVLYNQMNLLIRLFEGVHIYVIFAINRKLNKKKYFFLLN